MEERKGLVNWIKKHKKELIIAGVSIGTLTLFVLGIKNQETVKTVWDSLKNIIKQSNVRNAETIINVTVVIPQEPVLEVVSTAASNSDTTPFEVRRHIRNLPDGWHASPEKIAEALKNNIILMDGQTWVDNYIKGDASA